MHQTQLRDRLIISQCENTKIFLDRLILKTNHRQYVYEREQKLNNKLLSSL